ncbi:hypothetical protein EV126DRAFT_219646 [Verticillium dahliae]|nr:hypothetical protein EV126DRAFT_219646 [Verticillium dahliae]
MYISPYCTGKHSSETPWSNSPSLRLSLLAVSTRQASQSVARWPIRTANPLLRATAWKAWNTRQILASALAMNAYPPGMHGTFCVVTLREQLRDATSCQAGSDESLGFPPAMVYSELYEDEVRRAVSDFKPARCDLAPQIQEGFVNLASHNLKISGPSLPRIRLC